jgi:exopolysaccharide biosynthesis polyprenyl glycosylphosphotransferase
MAYPDVTGVNSALGELHAHEVPRPAVAHPRDVLRRWRRPALPRPGLGLGLGKIIHERTPLAEVARRDRIFRRSLAFADIVAAALALGICAIAFGDLHLEAQAVLALPLVVVAGKLQGTYDRDDLLINKTTIDQAPQLFQLATLYSLLVFLLQDVFVAGVLGPIHVLLLWSALFVLLALARRLSRGFARSVTPVERCLFVGSESSYVRLRVKLASVAGRGELVGRMSLGDAARDEVVPAAAETMHRLIEDLGVHRVVIEPTDALPQATLDFIREAKASGARVSLLPRILEVVGSAMELDDLNGLTLLGLRRFGLSGSALVLKRSFDAVVGGAGLLLIAPLLSLVALMIRIDSPGPVIYRQTRVGRHGRHFTIWKFRTMVDGADALKPTLQGLNESDGLFKIAEDPRVTRVGRVLRRFSLDELPQLVNVLRGEMSLVGPRPLVTDEDARITGLDRRRLQLTPGMTGHWQILGSARVPLAEMIKLDYLYVSGWSLWSDLKILMRTLPYVLARRGM